MASGASSDPVARKAAGKAWVERLLSWCDLMQLLPNNHHMPAPIHCAVHYGFTCSLSGDTLHQLGTQPLPARTFFSALGIARQNYWFIHSNNQVFWILDFGLCCMLLYYSWQNFNFWALLELYPCKYSPHLGVGLPLFPIKFLLQKAENGGARWALINLRPNCIQPREHIILPPDLQRIDKLP